MDMAKYVAVGVLAVIVLATVTYEAPEEAPSEAIAAEDAGEAGDDAARVTGSFGGTEPEDAVGPTGDFPPTGAEALAPAEPEPATPEPAPSPASAPSPAPAADDPKEVRVTVKPGQTLSDVAEELLGSRGRWKELYEYNRERIADPDVVRAGVELLFPADDVDGGGAAAASASSAPTRTAADGRTYTVSKGDTLYSIARAQLGSGKRWREIKDLNGLPGEHVAAGTVLELPK